MTVKDTLASCLIIALGAILALHFALFWLYGGVFIHESNKLILTIETVMSAAIIGFGLERLACAARSARSARSIPANRSSRRSQGILGSPYQSPRARTASSGCGTTAVTAAGTVLFRSDSSSADSRTQGVYQGAGDDSDTVVCPSQVEHRRTVDTTSPASSPIPSV